ncbi:MAG: hypothetical protein AABX54_01175 [Nanoarchaeota archaeon]
MSFSISFDKGAANYLENLPADISERIINKFGKIKENPFISTEINFRIKFFP